MDLQRRAFLKGAAVASGTAVAAAAVAVTGAAAEAKAAGARAAGAADRTQPPSSVSFHGANQAGVLRPAQPQASSCFASFALTAKSGPELAQLLQTLTARIRFLTAGGAPEVLGEGFPPPDSEVLGSEVPADGLSVTVGLAASVFDGRFGIASKKPNGLTEMTAFPNDVADPAWLGGDLLLQICANSVDTVHHALRDITKHTRALMQTSWQIHGFVSAPRPTGAPRNLFGYKDGISNPDEASG